jgi:hypothetical protein
MFEIELLKNIIKWRKKNLNQNKRKKNLKIIWIHNNRKPMNKYKWKNNK